MNGWMHFIYLIFLLFAAWHKAEFRKGFFEKYANENDFDALNHVDWLSQSSDHILSAKVFFLLILFIIITILNCNTREGCRL